MLFGYSVHLPFFLGSIGPQHSPPPTAPSVPGVDVESLRQQVIYHWVCSKAILTRGLEDLQIN